MVVIFTKQLHLIQIYNPSLYGSDWNLRSKAINLEMIGTAKMVLVRPRLSLHRRSVRHGGNLYIAIQDNTTHNPDAWSILGRSN